MADLSHKIAAAIKEGGPLTVSHFMGLALNDPDGGYYGGHDGGKDPLGARGDFITAPEISQIFGEMVGLWLVDQWETMGAPHVFRLIELGPGRGTLMADALRAASLRPEFAQAARLHLVERSGPLKALQEKALKERNATWWEDFNHLISATGNDGPILLVANEFLDALPIEQLVFKDGKWFERCVHMAEKDGEFEFTLSAQCVPPPTQAAYLPTPDEGSLFEQCSAAAALASTLAAGIREKGGAALLIDYGHENSAYGETWQALRNHKPASVLEAPGKVDLTAHVDFAAFSRTAQKEGAAVFGPVTQGDFLRALGAEVRAAALMAGKDEKTAQALKSDLTRLIGADEMGTLFKVLAITAPGAPAPQGF